MNALVPVMPLQTGAVFIVSLEMHHALILCVVFSNFALRTSAGCQLNRIFRTGCYDFVSFMRKSNSRVDTLLLLPLVCNEIDLPAHYLGSETCKPQLLQYICEVYIYIPSKP